MFVLQMCLFAAKVTCMYTKDDTQIVQVLGLNSGSGCFYSVASCSIFTCVSISLSGMFIRLIFCAPDQLGFYHTFTLLRIMFNFGLSLRFYCFGSFPVCKLDEICWSVVEILICDLIADGPWWHTHVLCYRCCTASH